MQLTITTNLDAVRKQFAGLEKQVNFAASKALNDVARKVQQAMPSGLKSQLDRPTPFTASAKATRIIPAKRDNLAAEVVFKDVQAGYLKWQVEGGVRSPARKALKLPTAINLNEYGNVPRGIISQLISVARKESKMAKRTSRRIKVSNKLELFYGDPADLGGHRFPPGIYKIVQRGAGSQLVPLVVFPATTAKYKKRLDLARIAAPVVSAELPAAFDKALREELASAK